MQKTGRALAAAAMAIAAAGTTLGITGTAVAAQPDSVTVQACTQGDITIRAWGGWGPERGQVHWVKCRDHGFITVRGWVKDTRPDGLSVEAYARFSNGAYRSARARGLNDRNDFYWRERAHDATVDGRVVH